MVKIPKDRVGVLVGQDGTVKKHIESNLPVNLQINGNTGDVTINLRKKANDPSVLFRAKEFIQAIGRGFSQERADKLFHSEYNIISIIDLRDIFGRHQSEIKRVKGRVIGKNGKTRKIIEELTEVYISVYGYTITLLGDIEHVEIAKQSVEMLIKGSQHSTVYKFLQKKRHDLKRKKLQLWEGRPLVPEDV
jgi:ribosomal RNA assembly protein